MTIPRIIHQTWKDEEIPERWVTFRESWQIHHPDWEYRLWTDEDNEQLIRKHYKWFWPIYDGYAEVIKKVDAVRYFILHRHGGMYVDLDFECLRPLDDLLGSRRLAIGLEPASHVELSQAVERSLDKILCNAFIASTREHPFWEHVFKGLIQYHRQPGPLDATGPFFLTRVYDDYPDRQTEDLISAGALYPATNSDCWEGRLDDALLREQICGTAYAVHHWHGTWWKDEASKPHPLPIDPPEQVPLHLMLEGRVVLKSQYLSNVYRQLSGTDESPPRISCMLVTKGRAGQARCAIQCFRNQTYSEKELVIVEDDTDTALRDYVATLDDQRIKFVKLPPESKPLGELRNLAVEHATGSYVAQWDDDDLYHPERLSMQMNALQALSADACFLLRHTMWWTHSNRMAYARPRIWEGTMLCAKDKLPTYPEHRRGEDTVVVMELTKTARIALLDVPQLYVYICHDQNTFEVEHFEEHWEAATTRIQGATCAEQLRLLEDAMPIQPYLKACEPATHAHP